jgi:hypothetical protein
LADEQDWLYKKAQEVAECRRQTEQANRRAEQERQRAAELTARLEAQA